MKLRIPLHAVFYKEENHWIAHCLEFDLVGHGQTRKAALKMLCQAILVQLEASIKYNNPENLFSPAEGKFFAMYAAGKDYAIGELEFAPMETDSVTIENVTAREYSDAELAFI